MRSPAGTAHNLQEFTLTDQRRLWLPDPDWEIDGTVSEDYRRVRLSRLSPSEAGWAAVDQSATGGA